MDMEKLLSGDFPFYRFRNLSAYPELMHFVSSGVKNIGFSDRENPEIIQHNRRSLAADYCPAGTFGDSADRYG